MSPHQSLVIIKQHRHDFSQLCLSYPKQDKK
jgi:hypothetical protein